MLQKIKKVLYNEYDETGVLIVEDKLSSEPIPLIRTHYNSRFYPKHGEINLEPSMTIPDEAMTIAEIVRRYASGLPLTGGKVPMYEEEGDMPDLSKLDLAERQIIIEEAQEEIKAISDRVNKRKQEAAEYRMEKLIKERLAKKEQEKGEIPNEEK